MKQKPLSTTVSAIRPSGIRRIFEIACENPDGIDLSIGDPDFDIPDLVKQEAIEWIKRGFNGYVTTRGIPELREVIKRDLEAHHVAHEDILVTAGATAGHYLAMLATVSPGDEVLVADPHFVSYQNVVIMVGGVPRLFNTYPDFRLRLEEIEPLISERTRAIVINHPNNPTGTTYPREDLEMIADLARRHNLHIVSDEIYDRFVFGGSEFVSIGNVVEDAIIIRGFSKMVGMTGWRLGYVATTKRLIDAMATFQQYSYVCANSIAQKAALRAYELDTTPLMQTYQGRAKLVASHLSSKFKFVEPQGAFFIFPEAPGGDAEAFVNRAIERKVFTIPGAVFSARNTHFRISLAAPDEQLLRAVEILNDVAEEF